MSAEAPPFQESARCVVCKCSFNTFRRRHHCRCCGRTLCHEHSSFQMALPQFGIHSTVRVCADCFNNSVLSSEALGQPPSINEVDQVANTVSKLNLDGDVNFEPKPAVEQQPALSISECKCGMPLCICVAPVQPSITESVPSQKKATSTSTQYNSKPKKVDSSLRNRGSSSNSKLRNPADESRSNYEASGEGLREAIKNGDTQAVKKLLSEGVDANYHDKQGLSLLHVAAVFNQTEIVFALIENGASLDHKNSQGQVLRGHKRSHLVSRLESRSKLPQTTTIKKSEPKIRDNLDQNLPATIDDDGSSHLDSIKLWWVSERLSPRVAVGGLYLI